MNEDTKNFWVGATWFVGLSLLSAVILCLLVWGNRYMQFDHVHDHAHPQHSHVHEHEDHKHPHQWPEHEHRHTHELTEG